MDKLLFGRLVTAMVTPFTEDGANIDYRRAEKLIEYLLETGSDSIVVAGTTGESPTLLHDEKLELFRFVKHVVKNRAKVLAGTSSNHTREAVLLSREAEDCGVDGLLLVAPYYNRPSQEGLYQHFASIASASNLPCMLYNVPGRAGVNLEVATQLRLAEIPNVAATKEAAAFEQLLELVTKAPEGFDVYTGDDKCLLPALSIGARGIVSVASNIIGQEMKQIIDSFLQGETKLAADLNREWMPILSGLVPNPEMVKACMNELGLTSGPLRLPLVTPPQKDIQANVDYMRQRIARFL